MVAARERMELAVKKLVQMAIDRGSQDNVSAVVIKL